MCALLSFGRRVIVKYSYAVQTNSCRHILGRPRFLLKTDLVHLIRPSSFPIAKPVFRFFVAVICNMTDCQLRGWGLKIISSKRCLRFSLHLWPFANLAKRIEYVRCTLAAGMRKGLICGHCWLSGDHRCLLCRRTLVRLHL